MQTTMNDSTYLTFDAVGQILGKSRWPIHRLVKAGRLDKVGRGRSARISLASVLRYIEEEKQAAKAVTAVSATVGVNLAKGRELLRRKREEDKLRRALENIAEESGTPKTATNPTGDPRFEPCVYDGICMTVAERDELIEREHAIRRAMAARPFRSVPRI
jgi:hypothetical protein